MGKEKENLEQEINEAIDTKVTEANKNLQEEDFEPGENLQEVQEEGESGEFSQKDQEDKKEKKESSEESKDSEDKSVELDDSLVERAIKAGLTLADVKTFPSDQVLKTVLSRLEDTGTPEGKDSSDETKDKSSASSDGNSEKFQLPDLDPNDYDEKIVEGFETMKRFILHQQEIISNLQGNLSKGEGEWFEGKTKDLGDEFQKSFEKAPERKDLLREKFDILQQGYKVSGKDVAKDKIFDEAVSMVLGDVNERIAAKEKAEALRKRSSQHITRPSGNRVAPKSDNILSDVAEEINRKFFNND